jgi:APA family basic amino acid/polyamine antiporter
LTGTFEELTSLFVFAAWIFYALSVVAMFRLRRIAPELPRPYRTWGYPVVPALFVAGALALTVNIWIVNWIGVDTLRAFVLSGVAGSKCGECREGFVAAVFRPPSVILAPSMAH